VLYRTSDTIDLTKTQMTIHIWNLDLWPEETLPCGRLFA
jgi:hypothetical protein